MGLQQFSNNASALLASTINNSVTTVTVQTGLGSLFPSLTGSQFFVIAVEDTSGNIEYMKVTARSGDNLTVVRGFEGSTAQAFTANLARVELRPTAGTLSGFLQSGNDTLTGPLNGGAQTITNVILSGAQVSIENAGEIVNTPIRSATGVATNQITFPSSGARPQVGGVNIAIASDLTVFTTGMIIMWYGALGAIPAGWVLCNGANSTPNLTDQFVVGAGGTLAPAVGNTGGSPAGTYTTGASSAGTATDGHALTATEMPSHSHAYWGPSTMSGVANGSGHGWDWGTTVAYQTAPPTGIPGGEPSSGLMIQTTGGTGGPGAPAGNGAAHSHTMTATSHSHTYQVYNPQFTGLYFIMKT